MKPFIICPLSAFRMTLPSSQLWPFQSACFSLSTPCSIHSLMQLFTKCSLCAHLKLSMGSYQCRQDQVPILTETTFWAFLVHSFALDKLSSWSAHFPPFTCLASSYLTLGLSPFMKNLGGLPGNSHSHRPIGYSFFRKGTPGKHRLSLYTVACSGPRTLPGMYWAFNNYLSNTLDLPKYLPSYVFLPWHHELCVSTLTTCELLVIRNLSKLLFTSTAYHSEWYMVRDE